MSTNKMDLATGPAGCYPPPINIRIHVMLAPECVQSFRGKLIDEDYPKTQVYAPTSGGVIRGTISAENVSFFPTKLRLLSLTMRNTKSLDMGALSIKIPKLPFGKMRGLERLIMCDLPSLPRNFLAHNVSLEYADLSHMKSLRETKGGLLMFCRNLAKVLLPPNLEIIGSKFLMGTAIEAIDTSLFSKVKKIGGRFLGHCGNLTDIDLSFMRNMEEIPTGFLCRCFKLKKIDLTCMENLKSIGPCFNHDLKKLALPLSTVQTIDEDFRLELRDDDPTTLDLSSAINLTSVGRAFMQHSHGIETLILPPNLTSIGDFFVYGSDVRHIDLTQLSKLRVIPNYFMHGLRGDQGNVDLRSWQEVETIGDQFMSSSQGITTFRMVSLPLLRSLGHKFLDYSKSLTSVVIENLPELREIGDEFASLSESIRDFRMANLPKLEKIGSHFLDRHGSHVGFYGDPKRDIKIELIDLPSLREIGYGFIAHNKVVRLKMSVLPQLQRIGGEFLANNGFLHVQLPEMPSLRTVGLSFMAFTILSWDSEVTLPEGIELELDERGRSDFMHGTKRAGRDEGHLS